MSTPPQRRPSAPQRPTGPPPRRPSQTPPPEDVITQRTLVGAVVLTALITAIVASLVFAVVLERGREGPRGPAGVAGPQGEKGPKGERGRTARSLRTEALVEAIQRDPGRVSDALADAQGLDGTADPLGDSTAADVEQDVVDLRDQLQSLCDALRSSGSVTTEDLPC